MANGHGEETWLDILREWMPGIVAFFTWLFGVVAAAAVWFARDRARHLRNHRQLRTEFNALREQVERLDDMETYDDRITSKRVSDLLKAMCRLQRQLDAQPGSKTDE